MQVCTPKKYKFQVLSKILIFVTSDYFRNQTLSLMQHTKKYVINNKL